MKHRVKLICLILLLSTSSKIQAQKDNQFNTWITYSGNHTLKNRFSVHVLYSFRRNDFLKNWAQSLLRLGLNYKVNDHLIITPGFDWALTFPYGKQPISKPVHDRRIYEQILLKNKIGRFNLSHRFRLEQRFIGNGTYVFRNRIRYRFTVVIPLNNKEMTNNTVYFKAFNELFMNFGKDVGSHYFDQNWAYIGIGFQFNKSAKISLGYMNQYLPKPDNIRIENNHTLMIGISYSII